MGGGGGSSLTIGSGPAVGWYPLAPGEAWYPAYRTSPRYVSFANFNINLNAYPRHFSNHVWRQRPHAITRVREGDFRRDGRRDRTVQVAPRLNAAPPTAVQQAPSRSWGGREWAGREWGYREPAPAVREQYRAGRDQERLQREAERNARQQQRMFEERRQQDDVRAQREQLMRQQQESARQQERAQRERWQGNRGGQREERGNGNGNGNGRWQRDEEGRRGGPWGRN
jgi:hypothetical protein